MPPSCLRVYYQRMKKNNESSRQELLIGRKPVADALSSEVPLSAIWIDRALRGPEEIQIRKWAKEQNIPLKRVARQVLNKKTKANHQGVIAFTSPVRFADLENVIQHVFSQGETPLLLYLDRIQDVGNLGSIIRTAEVMGVHALVIPAQKMAPINDQVIKISAGAVFHIPVCRINHVTDAMELMKNTGIRIVASSLKSDKKMKDVDLTDPVCLVIGSEDTGISQEIESLAEEFFIIPQYGHTESLNAAVAAAMMMYEARRQRNEVLR